MKLEDALTGVARFGFDTAPIIYFVERDPRYDALVTEFFQRVADGKIEGRTSVVSLSKVLVHPLRSGHASLAQQYRDLLTDSTNFSLVVIDAIVAEQAAELRARYNIRTPDAFQIAAALQAQCGAFLTNDFNLKCISELRVVVLDELEI